MLGVQFARPENLHNCPGRGGAQKPAEPLQERARGSKMPEMRNEPSTLPRCEARPTPVCRPAPAPEDRGYPPGAPLEPGTRRKKLGENRAPEEHKDQSGSERAQRPALAQKAPGPKFPEAAALGTFHRTRCQARQSSVPPATTSPFSWDPRRPASLIHRARSPPSAASPQSLVGVRCTLLFVYPFTFCPAKWGKGSNQKATSKKFPSHETLHQE